MPREEGVRPRATGERGGEMSELTPDGEEGAGPIPDGEESGEGPDPIPDGEEIGKEPGPFPDGEVPRVIPDGGRADPPTDGSGRPPDGDDPPPGTGDDPATEAYAEDLAEVMEQLDDLEAVVDSPEERERVRATRRRVLQAAGRPRAFGNVITGFDAADAAEAFLGSLLLGIPMLVEGGTLEIGAFLATRPLLLAGTVVANVAVVVGVLYVAEFQDVRIHEPFLGFVPRRLVGVLVIAYGSAVLLMTAWGRVEWALPADAFAKSVVAAVPMSLGAALGDILPGS